MMCHRQSATQNNVKCGGTIYIVFRPYNIVFKIKYEKLCYRYLIYFKNIDDGM